MSQDLLTIESTAHIGKKLTTSRRGKGGEDEVVSCSIALKGLRVMREQLAILAGIPLPTIASLFNEMGMPWQRVSFLLTKRELLGAGRIEHRRDSGATIASLSLTTATVADVRFNLDVPEEAGPTAMLSFTLIWKAAGDEVDDVKDLLGRSCYINLTFKEPPQQMSLDQPAPPALGIDRKSLAAGEKPNDIPPDPVKAVDEMLAQLRTLLPKFKRITIREVQDAFNGMLKERAEWMLEQLETEGLVGPGKAGGPRKVLEPQVVGTAFERDAKAAAKRSPRREPPKGGKRGR